MRTTSFALLSSLLLGLLLACNGSGSGSGGNTVAVSVQAAFQKRVLASTGSYSLTTLPARYCRVSFADSSTGNVVGVGGVLDGTGQGTFQVPQGSNVYAIVWADWAVPGRTAGSAAFMEGYTVNAAYGNAFASATDWYVTSNSFTASSSGLLTVTALDDANHISGAFNIADQGVTFALGMRNLVSDASLPSVAMYWSTLASIPDTRVYPNAILSGSNLTLLDGRAVFQAMVNGNVSGLANTEEDEWDDGVLGETYAHLLFAPYSYKPDGSSGLSYLRSDTENVPYISLTGPSEPSMAFTTGFADFLSAAFRGNAHLLDSYWDGAGILRVQDENLSTPNNTLGEFSRLGVAGSLWSMWGALGGGQPGLQILFNDTLSSRPLLDFVGDYTGSPLGCFPTYLVGLRADSGSAWTACQTAFGAWGVSNPTNLYFTGTNLWTNEAVPFTVSGAALSTPASDANLAPGSLCYGKSGAALYRFTQGSPGSRTITMTPTDGQEFELDLLGPNGAVAFAYASPFGLSRTLTPSLAAGAYVIRVRVNPDNNLVRSAGTYHYNLSLN